MALNRFHRERQLAPRGNVVQPINELASLCQLDMLLFSLACFAWWSSVNADTLVQVPIGPFVIFFSYFASWTGDKNTQKLDHKL